MVRAHSIFLLPLLAACPSDPPLTAGPETGDEADSSSSGGAPLTDPVTSGSDTVDAPTLGTTAATEATSSTGTTDAMFDPPEQVCGNGYIEGDEECDDANAVESDGCTSSCQVPCGLEREYIELAPSAQSAIGGHRVLAAPDGGVVTIGGLQKITLDMEGVEDAGPRQILVIAYDNLGDKRWEQTLSGEMGDLDPQGVAVDAEGSVFVAGTVDGADGLDVWVSKRAALDGAEVWTQTHDGQLEDSDDVARGLAITPQGDVIVSAQVYDAAQDSDVWLRKIRGTNGNEMWTTSWSGTPNNGFSIDRGYHVAVDAENNVIVLAREYVNYKRLEVTLLKFAGSGGEPLWTASPLADGTDHTHEPTGLAVDAAGDIVFSASRYGAGGPMFWLYKYSASGAQLWDLDRADFEAGGDDWETHGVSISSGGDVLVGGFFLNEDKAGDVGWYEAWVARLTADGERRCQVSERGVSDDVIPPSLFAFDIAGGADDVAVVTGRRDENGEPALWTALLRPL